MKKIRPPTCSPKTAVAYARYSSAGQRDVSIDQQLADIRAFARREGYKIVHEFADHAKSGFKNTSSVPGLNHLPITGRFPQPTKPYANKHQYIKSRFSFHSSGILIINVEHAL